MVWNKHKYVLNKHLPELTLVSNISLIIKYIQHLFYTFGQNNCLKKVIFGFYPHVVSRIFSFRLDFFLIFMKPHGDRNHNVTSKIILPLCIFKKRIMLTDFCQFLMAMLHAHYSIIYFEVTLNYNLFPHVISQLFWRKSYPNVYTI